MLKDCELKASTLASIEKQVNCMSSEWLPVEKEELTTLVCELKALRMHLVDSLKNTAAQLTAGVQDRVRYMNII